jgi:hypothetical protein
MATAAVPRLDETDVDQLELLDRIAKRLPRREPASS